jgi:hypothetical protein
MRQVNLFVMGVDISFASVTMSAGESGRVVKPATTQPSTKGSVGGRGVETFGRVCVSRIGRACSRDGLLLSDAMRAAIIVDPSTCFVDVKELKNNVHRSGPTTTVHSSATCLSHCDI